MNSYPLRIAFQHRGETELFNTCTNGILMKKSTYNSFLKGHDTANTTDVMRLCTLSLSLNSRRHVVAILSRRGEKACFRMRVTLGVILIRSLANTKHIPGRLRSGSGVALEQWVYEEVIKSC